MIAMLRGTLAHRSPGEVVLDVAGVGYRVRIPTGTRLPTEGEVTLHTHLAVREDAMDLYGFADAADRDLFTTMLSVSGVGPKLALAAVDALGADGIRAAVIAEDLTALTSIPGVGKKGAQRMVLELRSKLGSLPTASSADRLPGGSPVASDPRAEVRQALGALGYGAAEVEQAIKGLPGDQPTEALIRQALKGLA